jgi:hypothetical protein
MLEELGTTDNIVVTYTIDEFWQLKDKATALELMVDKILAAIDEADDDG